MGASSSKAATSAAKTSSRTLPRHAPGATPIAPFVEPSSYVAAPVVAADAKDLKLNEMMHALRVDTADVSAVDYGYAPAQHTRVALKPRAEREGLLKPRELRDALERHRAQGFAASTVKDILARRPAMNAEHLKLALTHMRVHRLSEIEGAQPGTTVVLGEWA